MTYLGGLTAKQIARKGKKHNTSHGTWVKRRMPSKKNEAFVACRPRHGLIGRGSSTSLLPPTNHTLAKRR
jgi:hypothetical protein